MIQLGGKYCKNIVTCLVTIDGVWIGSQIYWTLETPNYNLQFTITQTTFHSLHYSSLAAAPNGRCSSASGLTSSQAGDHLFQLPTPD
jgi:hypothetical protein